MATSHTWHTDLSAPAPGQHIAQLYIEPGFLARGVARFVDDGWQRGEAVILLIRTLHWQMIAHRLHRNGWDLVELQRRGQLAVLDTADCLAALLVDGMPDPIRFRTLVGGAVNAARAAGHSRVRAFGELVDVLRHTNLPAVKRLEDLWCEFVAAEQVTLLCGYSLDNFDPNVHRGILAEICAQHSRLVPVEDYGALEAAVTLAYTDVFGPGGDAEGLRRTLLAHYVRPTSMPDAQAAMLAAGALVPVAADALVERVRHYYRMMTLRGPTLSGQLA